MISQFRNDEKGYLRWVQDNPNGFVVNADEPATSPDYPMVHRASCGLVSSPTRTNYTTRRYFKTCSHNVRELEQWAKTKRGRSLNPCRRCM